MKKSILVSAFILLLFHLGSAQRAQSVYFELFGPGVASFNYDVRFAKKEDGLGGRIGLGGYSIDGEGLVYIPIGLNLILGKNQKRYFEIGAGVTPVMGTVSDNNDGELNETFGHLLFGYRMQPLDGGYTFRVFINPIFGEGFFIPYYFGISFGYKFQ